eukprot:26252-Prymnesium_polylepis.1
MLVVWLRSRHLRPRGERRLADTVAGKRTDAREKQRRRRKGLAGGRGLARTKAEMCFCSSARAHHLCDRLQPRRWSWLLSFLICVARLTSRASSRSPARRTSWETLGR